jgi:hypothetical protein
VDKNYYYLIIIYKIMNDREVWCWLRLKAGGGMELGSWVKETLVKKKN